MLVSLLLFAPAAALLVWYATVRTSNSSAIRALEERVRQKDEPLTFADLESKHPPIPDGENAAVELMAIWEREDPAFWKAFRNGERHLPERARAIYDPALPFLGSDAQRVPRTGPLNSNWLAAAEAYLNAHASHLEQARTALRRTRCQFPVKFRDGPGALLPHLASLKTEAQNLLIVALLASERGDRAAAISALRDAARAGQILSDEPVLISQLVRLACLNLALNGIEQLLSRQPLAEGELEQLHQVLEELNLHGVARSALVNERPLSLCVFDPEILGRAATGPAPEDDNTNPEQSAQGAGIGLRMMKVAGFLDADRRLMLETLDEAIDLAGQETPESLQQIEKLLADFEVKARKFPPKIFSSLMLPALQKVPCRFATFEARRRAGLTAIAVERFRLEHGGQTPETLEALVPTHMPAVPVDPFDGKTIRFRKLERGFVVYSIGEDREDNGGKERVRSSPKQTDVTFLVER